jgi:hypothetical protein
MEINFEDDKEFDEFVSFFEYADKVCNKGRRTLKRFCKIIYDESSRREAIEREMHNPHGYWVNVGEEN